MNRLEVESFVGWLNIWTIHLAGGQLYFYFGFYSSVFIASLQLLSEICIFSTVKSASCVSWYSDFQKTFFFFFLVSAMISVFLVDLLVSCRLHPTLLTHRPGHWKNKSCIRGENVFKYGCLIIITMMIINVLYRQKHQSRLHSCTLFDGCVVPQGPECHIWLDSWFLNWLTIGTWICFKTTHTTVKLIWFFFLSFYNGPSEHGPAVLVYFYFVFAHCLTLKFMVGFFSKYLHSGP